MAQLRAGLVLLCAQLAAVALEGCVIKPPGRSYRGELPELTPQQTQLSAALRAHVEKLAAEIGERNVWKIDALNQSARYIRETLEAFGYEVREQEYESSGQIVKNLEAQVDGTNLADEIVVVGAHYDSVRGCPAANDNGTGVAGVLEIARSLAQSKPRRTIRFVFFTNEEPPFFQTDEMGSMVYAKSCRQRGEKIVAMLSLETIGCYSDGKGSQNYPFPIGFLYPATGNFIAFVGNSGSKQLLHEVIASFRKHAKFPSEGGAAPEFITGVGWSDHWSFWQYGYAAIMVTDTAPFRYRHYHEPTDTPDKIDYDRTARVVDGLIIVVCDLGRAE